MLRILLPHNCWVSSAFRDLVCLARQFVSCHSRTRQFMENNRSALYVAFFVVHNSCNHYFPALIISQELRTPEGQVTLCVHNRRPLLHISRMFIILSDCKTDDCISFSRKKTQCVWRANCKFFVIFFRCKTNKSHVGKSLRLHSVHIAYSFPLI